MGKRLTGKDAECCCGGGESSSSSSPAESSESSGPCCQFCRGGTYRSPIELTFANVQPGVCGDCVTWNGTIFEVHAPCSCIWTDLDDDQWPCPTMNWGAVLRLEGSIGLTYLWTFQIRSSLSGVAATWLLDTGIEYDFPIDCSARYVLSNTNAPPPSAPTECDFTASTVIINP